ncbi:DEAD/DEAH box helicase [Micromonospora sp. B006]|uniref:DEAD/DEAH box helicase n=1 Tax=Micromonospora sp. B006 TaxID=2201999 RepID=UPI000E306385|nr:DEAD/DEAH box helicase [Micromonospora sp. B006]AXO33432.1 DNA repair helicase [Micromonospora sp. B006]
MHEKQMRKALWQLLAEWPGQNKRQLLAGLRILGLGDLSTRDVNRVLYAGRQTFTHDGATPPRWHLTAGAGYEPEPIRVAPLALPQSYLGKEPRAWQREALAEWQANGRRGVVEAVTGTGKTTVGVLAAAAAVDAGEKVLVLVPGCELLDQWYEVLRLSLPSVRIGRLGDRHRDSLSDHSILVAVVHSAIKDWILPPYTAGLLIADEVHRYGAEGFASALEDGFGARLGLTATYERTDSGVADRLQPYFGDVVAGCTYERGLTEDILAPFRVAFVGADFARDEHEQYKRHDERVRTLRRRLILDHGCPAEPFGDFMAEVNELSQPGNRSIRSRRDARGYLRAFSQRRQILAGCRRKHKALASLAPVFAEARAGIIFTETAASTHQATKAMRKRGLRAMDFTSALDRPDRKDRLSDFKSGEIQVLVAPRVLDEGVDVPEAEIGVVLASSKSKRQMIQRMGRVIRPKPDRRPATFVVLYIRGTSEDPHLGAHEGFIEQLTDVADACETFDPGVSSAELLSWYREGITR